MSDPEIPSEGRTAIVYFIDDSATMREVIKIAFRKENIHVITCPDAASAIAQFPDIAPDAVITDVIMPDRDGYEVCEFVKRQEQFSKTPVILMSGIVNREVAERAMAVKADELIRKPFQPQDLVARVKKLLNADVPELVHPDGADSDRAGAQQHPNPLRGLFAAESAPAASAAVRAHRSGPPVAVASHPPAPAARAHAGSSHLPATADVQKLRNEIWRLELLVKKLQADLEAQHQYCAALEAHLSTLQEIE